MSRLRSEALSDERSVVVGREALAGVVAVAAEPLVRADDAHAEQLRRARAPRTPGEEERGEARDHRRTHDAGVVARPEVEETGPSARLTGATAGPSASMPRATRGGALGAREGAASTVNESGFVRSTRWASVATHEA